MIFRRRDDSFHSFSLGEFLTRPFRAVGGFFNDRMSGRDSINSEQSLLANLVGWVTFPFQFLLAFAVFMVQSWATSRLLKAFVAGLPAVLVVSAFLAALWTANFFKDSLSVQASQAYFYNFLQESPDLPDNARIFAEKLVGLKPQDPEKRYQLGLAREMCDDIEGALDIMTSLAPEDEDRAGFSNAHVWLAQYYLRTQRLPLEKQERESKMVRHLERAIEGNSENAMAHMSLANYYETVANEFERGSPEYVSNLEIAIGHVKEIIGKNEEIVDMNQIRAIRSLVQLQIAVDRRGEAASELRSELNRIEPIARNNPDVYEIWHTLVSCAVYLEDYKEANRIIESGYQLAQSPEVRNRFVNLASEVFCEQADKFTDMTNRGQYGRRLALLCKAVELHPRNQGVYTDLVEFVAAKSNPDFNESWLRESIIGDETLRPNPGVIHALLGVLQSSRGNVLEGQQHWRIGQEQLRNADFIVNNLIAVAASNYAEDFPNIQDVVTLAIELFPDQALLYQTRGELFKNQERYEDAIADLEVAAAKLPNLLSVRQQLIDCYEAIGRLDQANDQKLVVEDILSQLDINQRRQYEQAMKRMN